MASKAITKCISLLMLFILAIGMTSSVIGEFRSHSMPLLSTFDSEHSHESNHTHTIDDKYSFYHDASNHNHVYDNVSFKENHYFSLERLLSTSYDKQESGSPRHKPFTIERPPKALLFS